MIKPTHKAIHIAKSLNANCTSQNLSISMSLPTLTKRKYDTTTLCISNGGQSAINEINMNKINGGARMKASANKTATTHTRNRCAPYPG